MSDEQIKNRLQQLADGADFYRQDESPVHLWFNLTYAQYLVLPRTVLQSMPREWQQQFVTLMAQLDGLIGWRTPDGTGYRVTLHQLKDDGKHGRAIDDPIGNYERGRRRLPLVLEDSQ